ncbi:MAG TPA: hypothetical protein VK841_17800 [Polyangiaceae bacterium]|jgi:hypothetical protein|nr:hypothetical protein [Polyangiaceae bacterium]
MLTAFAPGVARAEIDFYLYEPTYNELEPTGMGINLGPRSADSEAGTPLPITGLHVHIAAVGQPQTQDVDIPPSSANLLGSYSAAVTFDDSLPQGALDVEITLTNSAGEMATKDVLVNYFPPPVLTATSGQVMVVSDPNVRITATCAMPTNPNGCSSLVLVPPGANGETPALASGVSSIDQTFNFSTPNGPGDQSFELVGTSSYVDLNGAEQPYADLIDINVYIESSPALVRVDTVDGTIYEADAYHFLVLDDDGMTLKLYNRATQQYAVFDVADDPGFIQARHHVHRGRLCDERNGLVVGAGFHPRPRRLGRKRRCSPRGRIRSV